MICGNKPECSEKDDNIRKMILDRAQARFLAYGYTNTTTEQIASDLAISKKTLYKFFTKKEDLLLAVVARIRDDFNSKVKAIVENKTASFLEKAHQLAIVYSTFAAQAPAHYHRDLERFSPSWNKDFDMNEYIESFLEEGVKQGYLRSDVNLHLLMVYMQVSIRHMVAYAASNQNEFSVREILTLLPKLLIEGFLTDKGRSQMTEHF